MTKTSNTPFGITAERLKELSADSKSETIRNEPLRNVDEEHFFDFMMSDDSDILKSGFISKEAFDALFEGSE